MKCTSNYRIERKYMSILSRVYGIMGDGTILSAENVAKNHNELSLELYGEFLETLTSQQRELAQGTVSAHWPVAGAVVKNRKDLIFLELLGEDIDIQFCVTLVPTIPSSKQLLMAKERYETMKDMYFIDVTNCNGSEFTNHIDFKPFKILYEYLDNRSRVREKVEVGDDIDL